MRDHLHCRSEVFAPALLVEHVPVDLACRKIRKLVEILIDETFIMPQIQVCLSPVLCHIYFSVLERTHRSRIYIDIGIHLLSCDLKSAGLEQSSE